MKKVFFCAALLISLVMKAQQIQLEEAEVLYKPQVTEVKSNYSGSTYEVKVYEKVKGDFHRDPVSFMKKNLEMKNLIPMFNESDQSFTVNFNSNKGRLIASFNEKGELLSTSQNFENVALPLNLHRELYRNYPGWKMISNKYVAIGNSTSVEKQEFHIKLKKGKLTKNISLKNKDQKYALAMK